MSKYLRSVLNNNMFLCKLSLKFENKRKVKEKNIDAIIDTGCPHSHISIDNIYVFKLKGSRIRAKEYFMKIKKRPVDIGWGIESANKNINTDKTDVKNPYILIGHKMYNCSINGINIGDGYLAVSYDTSHVALLGMAIFQDWDIHIGKNKKGETVLLGCPNNQINQEYLLALEEEFGISQNINSAIIDKAIEDEKGK